MNHLLSLLKLMLLLKVMLLKLMVLKVGLVALKVPDEIVARDLAGAEATEAAQG